jgi:PAS domain-containing protein
MEQLEAIFYQDDNGTRWVYSDDACASISGPDSDDREIGRAVLWLHMGNEPITNPEPFGWYYEHKTGEGEQQFSTRRWDVDGRVNWVETPLYETPNAKVTGSPALSASPCGLPG